MTQDSYSVTPAQASSRSLHAHTNRHLALARVSRNLLIGTAISILLISIEAFLWIILGRGPSHTLPGLLSQLVSSPLILLLFLSQLIIICLLVQFAARPLALLAYVRAVQRAQEDYHTFYMPLANWSYLYESTLAYYQDTPDPTMPVQVRYMALLEMVETFASGSPSHLLLFGEPGAGKTAALHEYLSSVLQRRRAIAFGRANLPVFIPLKHYSLYLQTRESDEPQDLFLLDFLYACNLPGMVHVRPYLSSLVRRGRVTLLCDGLDEVEEAYQFTLAAELADWLSQGRNRLLLTCTEACYANQPQLLQAVAENLVPRAIFQPLDTQRMRGIVERFIEQQDAQNRWQHTAGQVMEMIERSRLRLLCITPLHLFALLAAIDAGGVVDGKRMDTCGRLLHAWIMRLLDSAPMFAETPAAEDVLLFLSEVACAAHWTDNKCAIQLPIVSATDTAPSFARTAVALHSWLQVYPARYPFGSDSETDPEALHGAYTVDKMADLLQAARQAALIEIHPDGVLSFRHALVASSLVATYLSTSLGTRSLDISLIHAMPADIDRWSDPLVLWVGLLEEPLETAQGFALYGQSNEAYVLEALLLSLICLGVAQTPPGVEHPQPLLIPPAVEAVMTTVLQDDEARVAFADLFSRCAEYGSRRLELYSSLFPLLALQGINEFITLLNPTEVTALLFHRLVDIAADQSQRAMIVSLIHALSSFGPVVVPRASELSRADSGSGEGLRSAAISILGGTHDQGAVNPLLECLHDSDPLVVKRAGNALVRLGPDLTLPRLLAELKMPPALAAPRSIHSVILDILRVFLETEDEQRRLTPEQHERIVEAIMQLLTVHSIPADVQKAQSILVGQARKAREHESGERTVDTLIQNLASPDETVARQVSSMLKEAGPVTIPLLIEKLDRHPSEAERKGITEVLESMHDPSALPSLLRLLADPSPAVRQKAALALRSYLPESIPGLIDEVLHNPDDTIAARAAQVLEDVDAASVNLVIAALSPVVPGRTQLLVHVLEKVGSPLAVPALIALLQADVTDQSLLLTIIDALGQAQDTRAVAPLLVVLSSSNPLLYEGAINALSSLDALAVDELLAALDTPEKTPLVERVQRALLGMRRFPGDALLHVLGYGTNAQVLHVRNIFLAKGAEGAQFLAANLVHPYPRTQSYVRQILHKMDGRDVVPAVIDLLDKGGTAWRTIITEYLLKHPTEAIPLLVSVLDDPERTDAATAILVAFGPRVLRALVPALDALNNLAQEHAQDVLVMLVRQDAANLPLLIQLCSPPLPQRAHEALLDVLTGRLADVSVPALLAGLEDAYLVGDTSEALVRMVKKGDDFSETVLGELLAALRSQQRRHGASIALVDLGGLAVPAVGPLITDADAAVAQAAQNILCDIGVPAFSFIWAARSDTANLRRREAAGMVFRKMPTSVIKDELVQLLASDRHEDISMALALLLERIHDEQMQPGRTHEMVPALLEQVQGYSDERSSLRILSLLLLLADRDVIRAIVQLLYDEPRHHPRLTHAFLLLGQKAEEALSAILHDSQAPASLRAEAAGILGILSPGRELLESAHSLHEHGLWAGRSMYNSTIVLQPAQLEIALRALGGLLVGGHWSPAALQDLRANSKEGSAERELYNILLGWRYTPHITRIEDELRTEREQRRQELLMFAEEKATAKLHIDELEHELTQLQEQHESRSTELEQVSRENDELQRELQRLNQEQQSLRAGLQQAMQDRRDFEESLQEALQERDASAAEAQRWRDYSAQLEDEVNQLRRP